MSSTQTATRAEVAPSRWVAQRGTLPVVCLNRRQRRERIRKPYKYNRWVRKTDYRPVGEDGDYGSRDDLVSKTTGLTTGMAVTWLGTSSSAPTPFRNVSSILLRLPQKTFVFDAGEGTQMQLMKTEIFPSSIKKIFLTHLHGDHCFGLPGLLSLINQVRIFHDRGEQLDIYGPPGLGELLRMSLPHWFDRFRMPITAKEFTTNFNADVTPQPLDPNGHVLLEQFPPTGRTTVDWRASSLAASQSGKWKELYWEIDGGNGVTVRAAQLQHRVLCWGYVIQEADYHPAPWEIDLWKKQQGMSESDVVDDATIQQILGYAGRKVVILGDTCNSDSMLSIGANADLLSHEATFSKVMEEKAMIAQHSTAEMAGKFAKRLNAKQLVLTHFSARYRAKRGASADSHRGDVQMLVAEASRAFGKDTVVPAKDFMTWHVPIQREGKQPKMEMQAVS